MTASIWNSSFSNASDSAFRAWGSALASQITGSERLTQTADTGQINWSTVIAPSSASGGYEIYSSSDVLTTFYIKMEFGDASGTPKLWITVGTNTDGAGTITGNVSTRTGIAFTSVTDATLRPSIMSASTNRLVFDLGYNMTSGGGIIVSIERLYDSTGVVTDDGVSILLATSSQFTQVLPFTGPVHSGFGFSTNCTSVALPPQGIATGIHSNGVGIYDIFPFDGIQYPPMMGVVAGFGSNFSTGPVTLMRYGSEHTYFFPGDITSSEIHNAHPLRPIILYE